MTYTQFLLLKLMEECAEVTHRASKQFQFGAFEVELNQLKNNEFRLQEEVIDLICVLNLIGFKTTVSLSQLNAKEAKIEKFRQYAEEISAMKVDVT